MTRKRKPIADKVVAYDDADLVRRALIAATPPCTTHITMLVALGDMAAECLSFAPADGRKELHAWFVKGLRLCLKQRVEDLAHAPKDDQ